MAGRVCFVMVAGTGIVLMLMLRMGLLRRHHLRRGVMRAGSAGRLQRRGKPLQGQRGGQKPEQEYVEGAFHSGEYISPFQMAVAGDVRQ
jgi:hypothetical protein